MKILFCSNFFQQTHNGAGVFAQQLYQINQLFPQHDIRILSEDISFSDTEKNEGLYTLDIQYPRILSGFAMLLRTFTYHKKAIEIKKSFDYDILFYNNAFTGIWSSLVSPKKTIVIGMIHDNNFMSFGLKDFKFTKRFAVRIFYKFFEFLSTKSHRIILCNSKAIEQEILSTYHCAKDKLLQMYYPVPIENISFSLRTTIGTTTPIQVLFVKNDYPRGGLHELIIALGQLNDFPFTLTVIGPFPSKLPEIESWIKQSKNIQLNFIGNTSQSIVYQEMSRQDILCIPAQKEALGIANIEGLAHGIPVVTTDVGGIPEVMQYGKNGWISSAKNPEQLSKNIYNCITQDEARMTKSKLGRAFVEKTFSTEQMNHSFLSILSKSLE